MSREYEFLKACGSFLVLSNNGDFPAGRPFGAVMEYKGDLYLSTNTYNQAHRQLREDGHMQILALKPGTREWVRITGMAKECTDIEMKRRMLSECPQLSKHFECADAPYFVLFQVKIVQSEFK